MAGSGSLVPGSIPETWPQQCVSRAWEISGWWLVILWSCLILSDCHQYSQVSSDIVTCVSVCHCLICIPHTTRVSLHKFTTINVLAWKLSVTRYNQHTLYLTWEKNSHNDQQNLHIIHISTLATPTSHSQMINCAVADIFICYSICMHKTRQNLQCIFFPIKL